MSRARVCLYRATLNRRESDPALTGDDLGGEPSHRFYLAAREGLTSWGLLVCVRPEAGCLVYVVRSTIAAN